MQTVGSTPLRHGRRSRALAVGILLAGLGLSVAGWWYAGAEKGPEFAAQRARLLPWLILGTGLVFAVASSLLMWALAAARARALGRADRMTEDLNRTEARFRAIFEWMPVGISWRELDGGLFLHNPAHALITGVPLEQSGDSQTFFRMTHPDDWKRQQELMAKIESGEIDTFSLEKRYRRPDGSTNWVALTMRRMKDPVTGGTYELCTLVDITALKRAQEETMGQEARFRFIFEAVPVGLSWAVLGQAETRLVNSAHERISGVSAVQSQEPGIHLRVTHPEDLPRQRELIERLERGEIDHYALEKRYVHADGSVVWAALTVRHFRDPGTGIVQEVVALVDITDFKRVQTELAGQDARFRFIFELVPVGLSWFQVGRQRETHLVNSAHARITGVPAEKAACPKPTARPPIPRTMPGS